MYECGVRVRVRDAAICRKSIEMFDLDRRGQKLEGQKLGHEYETRILHSV